MAEQTFAHIGLACTDPIATERFYAEHFGFRRARVVPIDDGQIVFVRTESGDLYFEIFPATDERPAPPVMEVGPGYPSFRHVSFQVASVDEKLKEMGDDARITAGPADFDEVIPGWRTVWVADPDDRIVEITQGFRDQDTPPLLPSRAAAPQEETGS